MGQNNTKIEIRKKPEDISYGDIYEIIFRAHEENRNKGLKINTKIKDGQQLEEHLKGATCFVALVDGVIAGTVSVRIEKGNKRFVNKLNVANLIHLAVLPQYKGNHIGTLLCKTVERIGVENAADAIALYVVDKNPAKEFYKYIGFEPIDYIPRIGLKQNTVYMVKWLKKSRTHFWKRLLYFSIKKTYVRLKYRFN